jgi:predicted DNA binding CopG/RHH family protein
MNKELPRLTTDEEAERFVETADLSQFDLGALMPHSFEFSPKSRQVNMRFSDDLLDAVKAKAAERGISYQRFIRLTLEAAVKA